MTIITSFSPNWFNHVVVQLNSLLYHNKCNEIVLFTDELSNEKLDIIDKISLYYATSIITMNVSNLFDLNVTSKVNITDRYKKHSLYRLLIPKNPAIGRCLYLDADTLVVADLADLYCMDLEDNYIAGAVDIGILPNHKYNIEMDEDYPYVNSGVLLMDVPKLRSDDKHNEFIKRANEISYLGLDQDIINVSCQGKIKVVSRRFNSSISTGFAEKPVIVHFTGAKPWDDIVPQQEYWDKAVVLYERIFGNLYARE